MSEEQTQQSYLGDKSNNTENVATDDNVEEIPNVNNSESPEPEGESSVSSSGPRSGIPCPVNFYHICTWFLYTSQYHLACDKRHKNMCGTGSP